MSTSMSSPACSLLTIPLAVPVAVTVMALEAMA